MGLLIAIVVLGLIFAIGIKIYIFHDEKKMREEQKRVEEQRKIAREQFLQTLQNDSWKFPVEKLYKKCKQNQIFEINSAADFQRIKLIIEQILHTEKVPKKYYEKYTSQSAIQQYMQQAEQIKEQSNQERHQRQAIKSAQEEEKKEQEYTRYANKKEREKSLAYCRDMIAKYNMIIAQCNDDATKITKAGSSLYELNKQHESSWAIHGGIAEGIAGPAAGLAVAADVERNNQQKREENATLAQSIAQVEVAALNKIWARKEKANQEHRYWLKEKRAVENILIKNEDEHELLALLRPSVKNSRVTASGAITLTINTKETADYVIYDNANAVVDGSFKVLIKAEGKTIGHAVCVIPYGGSYKAHNIKCICRSLSHKSDHYNYEFEPHHLWAEEAPHGSGWQE